MGPGPKYGENQLSSDKQLSIDGMQSLLQSIPGTGTYHAADSLLRDMFDEVDEDDSGQNSFASRYVRRALLTPQVDPGSLLWLR